MSNKKARQLLGLEPKPVYENKHVKINKQSALMDNESEDDRVGEIDSFKLYNIIQALKDDSDLSSIEKDDDRDLDIKKNIFTPKAYKIPEKKAKTQYFSIPKDRFIDRLEKLRIQKEQLEMEKQQQQEMQSKLEKEKQKEQFENKYLKQSLSIDSDLNDDDMEFMEYKLRRDLSLDDLY